MGNQVRLTDGRALGFATYGYDGGAPLFYFHGWPGSRLEAELFHHVATRLAVRIIAVDRPGFGLSGHQPQRRITDWPTDILELADRLDLSRFSVLGFSAGAPYALACARIIPHRLSSAAAVAGLGPWDILLRDGTTFFRHRLLNFIDRRASWLLEISAAFVGCAVCRAPAMAATLASMVIPKPDREFLSLPAVRRIYLSSLCESFRGGKEGVVLEGRLLARSWGFHLDEINAKVQLWHGELDRTVPVATGRSQARAIPNCQAIFYPAEGHYSLLSNRIEEILMALPR